MKKNLFALLLTVAAMNGAQAQGYHVMKSFPVGGSGGWDYLAVSPVTDEIYVSHSTQVNIINKNTGDSTGIIANTEGVHGIAFVLALKKGYTSNGKTGNVTVFDAVTHATKGQVKAGDKPDAIMYDPHTKYIYVCNGKSKDLTVIDPTKDEVVTTVSLGGKPETAVSGMNGKIYINIEDKSEVVVVNTKTWKIENHWKTGKGEEPSGLAIDVKTHRLFAGCGNKLMVVLNADNGKVVKELPIGDGCDGTAFDPATKTAFSSNGDGTLTVVKEKSATEFVVVENAATQKGARTIAVDEKTHLAYLPTAEFQPPTVGAPAQKRPSMIPGTFKVLVVGK